MKAIVACIVALFAGLTFMLCLGFEKAGLAFAAPFLLLIFAIVFGVEVWLHRYISKHGKFARMEKKQAQPSGKSGNP